MNRYCASSLAGGMFGEEKSNKGCSYQKVLEENLTLSPRRAALGMGISALNALREGGEHKDCVTSVVEAHDHLQDANYIGTANKRGWHGGGVHQDTAINFQRHDAHQGSIANPDRPLRLRGTC